MLKKPIKDPLTSKKTSKPLMPPRQKALQKTLQKTLQKALKPTDIKKQPRQNHENDAINDGLSATPQKMPSLEKSGLRTTLPRLKILEIFEKSNNRHLYAEDIYKTVLLEDKDVSLATIYRVLTQFEQAGLLRRHFFAGGKAAFELNNRKAHDHFVCLQCGHVEEFHSPKLNDLLGALAQERDFKINEPMVYLYVDCQKKNCPRLIEKNQSA